VRRAHCLPVISFGAAMAIVLLATARSEPRGATRPQIERVAAEVETSLRETAAAVRARAQTLAELPRLALAVATDPRTVSDLTDEELAFQPRPSETIELAQVPRAGGAPISLLRVPAAAPAMAAAPPGVRVVVAENALRVSATVRIEPRARADELYGLLTVSWPQDTSRLEGQLAALASGVILETPAGRAPVGGRVRAEHGTVALPVRGPAGEALRVIAPAPGEARWRTGPIAAAAVMALATLVATALILRGAALSRRSALAHRGAGHEMWAARTWTPPPPPSPYPPARTDWRPPR
jgi:hypothetical protein